MPRAHQGFGLVDVVVGVALLLVLFLALFGVLRASLMLSAIAKAKAVAVELGSTQMEYLRGLSYDALGTVGGIPAGLVPHTATTTVDGVSYSVRTLVVYRDDPADGTGAQDGNGITTDFKVARVSVSYSLNGLEKSIVSVSNFAPPGIESSTGGGTLSIHVVDAANADVSDASVRILNTSVSPQVDFTTFTNSGGFAVIGGAATSSQYQIYASKTGYSSAQTYARAGENVNPSPGYLTVSKDQTTGGTFFIDWLSNLTIASLSPAITASFSDSFADASKLSVQSGTQISGGALVLASEELYGTARSATISPSYLSGWGVLAATLLTPDGTAALIRVGDGDGTPLSDSVLPGNGAGFQSFPVSLTGIQTAGYPALTLLAELTSNATTTTPQILDWSISHTDGPAPLPNAAFSLTGAKTIGTDANDAPIYKTTVSGTTGAGAAITETLEWDSYSLSAGSLLESCPASPYSLAPASTTAVALTVGVPTANTLPVIVENNANNPVSSAKVVLSKSGYAATVYTSACGFSYFNGLAGGSYSATVSAAGYATTIFPNINVDGNMAAMTLVLP